MPDRFVSRSAIKTQRVCKREAYNTYHALGTGLRAGNRAPIDLLIGQGMHAAAEHLLTGSSIEVAINAAHQQLDTESDWIRSNQLQFDHKDDTYHLVELMTRLFEKLAMPDLFEQYEILEVEMDRRFPLNHIHDDIIYIEIKPDAKLRNRRNGELGAFSLKTTGKHANWMTLRDQLELQNYTEPWAVGGTFVQMCYMTKGYKGKDFPFQGNTLLYPYRKVADNGVIEWSWAYNYIGNDHKSHKMTQEWDRVPIWEHMSIREWLQYIDGLYSSDACHPWHRVNPYDKMCIMPLPIGRREDEIQDMMDALAFEEHHWFQTLDELGDRENDFKVLEQHFPREFTECATMTRTCPFYQACLSKWTPVQMRTMGFLPRVPHHAAEAASFETDD